MPRAGGRPEPEKAPSESAAADERATVRRSVRRGLITAFAAPLILGAVVGVVALAYYLIAGYSSILRPSQYDDLTIGQSEQEVEKVLPAMQMIDPPCRGLHAAGRLDLPLLPPGRAVLHQLRLPAVLRRRCARREGHRPDRFCSSDDRDGMTA